MHRTLSCAILALVALLALSQVASAQAARGGTQTRSNQETRASSPWKFHPTERAIGDGGPAPKRSLVGTWAGPSSGMAVPRTDARNPKAPPMTPLGQQLFAERKPMIGNAGRGSTARRCR